MTSDGEPTIGEVYRLVKAVREEHGSELRAISRQASEIQNTVVGHAVHINTFHQEIQSIRNDHSKAVWTAITTFFSIVGGVVLYWVTHK